MDLIRFVNNTGETLEQGDVVILSERSATYFYGPENENPVPEVDLTDDAYDTRVCGIVSEVEAELKMESQDGLEPLSETKKEAKTKKSRQAKATAPSPQQVFSREEFSKLDRTKIEPGQIGWLITLGPYAYCKVDGDISPIQIGDLLTTSPTKGYAQKVLDRGQAVGAILGKALGSIKKGKGKIPVLVMLQ